MDGYYVRITPVTEDGRSPLAGVIPIKNHPQEKHELAASIVSPDALALVNYGLRRADDQRIVNTVRVIDSLLKVELPHGPCWHRYNHDGYGEHQDGAPFDGMGVGRVWPLLTGERAHYELAGGRKEEAQRLLRAMAAFAGEPGMIPEQVWDEADIPERRLFFGRPSGSAMPLVWAHAEYIKLCRSLQDGKVYGIVGHSRPTLPRRKTAIRLRYLAFQRQNSRAALAGKISGSNCTIRRLSVGRSMAGNIGSRRQPSDSGLGVHHLDLPSTDLRGATEVMFTFYLDRIWQVGRQRF